MKIRCPACRHVLGRVESDGRLRLRVPLLAFSARHDGVCACETTCPKCKASIPVPVSLDRADLLPRPAPPGARLVFSAATEGG